MKIPEISMQWSTRRSRGRSMSRSTKKAQKIKQIGYQEEESSKDEVWKEEGETIRRLCKEEGEILR